MKIWKFKLYNETRMSTKEKVIRKKIQINFVSKIFIFMFSTISIIALLLMFFMIIREAIPSYKEYGFFKMLFSAEYSSKGGYGIWGSLSVTLFTSIIAILIASPISIRVAYFINFRVIKFQKILKIIVNIIAGIPSVVFGIFALKTMGKFSGLITGTESTSTIFNATIMLSFMIMPTMISLNLNQLKLVPKELIISSMSLGTTKTTSIYKVIRKHIKSGFYVSIIVGLGRAIGETMALSMILGTGTKANPFDNGLLDFVNSAQKTLGAIIASNMFTDASDIFARSPHFAAGISMFIITMILIGSVTKISSTKIFKHNTPKQLVDKYLGKNIKGFKKYLLIFYITLKLPFNLITNGISLINKYFKKLVIIFIYYLTWPIYYLIFPKKNNFKTNSSYYKQVSLNIKTRIFDFLRIFFEIVSLLLVLIFISWIIIDVFSIGLKYWTLKDWGFTRKFIDSTSISGGVIEIPTTLANTLSFTLVIIGITIAISIPFAVGTAVFLSEYAQNSLLGKIIRFFLDSLGGTPSILFGIFGMIFFANNGPMAISKGLSVMAGALTMFLVVLPTFTRSIEQVLITIPNHLRDASYALGASKFQTIRKVIVPQALPGIITGIILSAARIMAETAPLYLTVGMQGSLTIDIADQGWTMTTAIYNTMINSTASNFIRTAISYKIAALSIFAIIGIILLAELINPITSLINKFKKYFKNKNSSKYFLKNKKNKKISFLDKIRRIYGKKKEII